MGGNDLESNMCRGMIALLVALSINKIFIFFSFDFHKIIKKKFLLFNCFENF